MIGAEHIPEAMLQSVNGQVGIKRGKYYYREKDNMIVAAIDSSDHDLLLVRCSGYLLELRKKIRAESDNYFLTWRMEEGRDKLILQQYGNLVAEVPLDWKVPNYYIPPIVQSPSRRKLELKSAWQEHVNNLNAIEKIEHGLFIFEDENGEEPTAPTGFISVQDIPPQVFEWTLDKMGKHCPQMPKCVYYAPSRKTLYAGVRQADNDKRAYFGCDVSGMLKRVSETATLRLKDNGDIVICDEGEEYTMTNHGSPDAEIKTNYHKHKNSIGQPKNHVLTAAADLQVKKTQARNLPSGQNNGQSPATVQAKDTVQTPLRLGNRPAS